MDETKAPDPHGSTPMTVTIVLDASTLEELLSRTHDLGYEITHVQVGKREGCQSTHH